MAKKGNFSTSSILNNSAALNEESNCNLTREISKRYAAKTSAFHKALDSVLVFFLINGIIIFTYGLLTRDAYKSFLGGFLPPIGMFVLVMCLRSYTQEEPKKGVYPILGSFLCFVVIFFLAIINFIQ